MGFSNRNFSLVLVVLIFTITACTFLGTQSQPTSIDESVAPDWQAKVTTFKDFVRGINLSESDLVNDFPDPQRDFNPNHLLDLLPHLRIKPGYTLDYVYLDGSISGEPFLYVHRATDPPFENVWEYLHQSEKCEKGTNPTACNYLYFIETDGSKEGYFELVLLKMMGEQFYLYWHSYYNDKEIIASEERLTELVNSIGRDDFSNELTDKQKRAALKIDPTPQFIFEPGRVRVRVVWFTKWGGFKETTYTISTYSPTIILQGLPVTLVKYDCGYIY